MSENEPKIPPTGVNKAYSEFESTKNSRKPIDIPQIPADATLPQTDLWPKDNGKTADEELTQLRTVKSNLDAQLHQLDAELLKAKDDKIAQLEELVRLQKSLIAKLESQINTLLYGGDCGGGCGGSCSDGR